MFFQFSAIFTVDPIFRTPAPQAERVSGRGGTGTRTPRTGRRDQGLTPEEISRQVLNNDELPDPEDEDEDEEQGGGRGRSNWN